MSLLSLPVQPLNTSPALLPPPLLLTCSYERSSQFVGRALRMPENANLVSAACSLALHLPLVGNALRGMLAAKCMQRQPDQLTSW